MYPLSTVSYFFQRIANDKFLAHVVSPIDPRLTLNVSESISPTVTSWVHIHIAQIRLQYSSPTRMRFHRDDPRKCNGIICSDVSHPSSASTRPFISFIPLALVNSSVLTNKIPFLPSETPKLQLLPAVSLNEYHLSSP